MDPFSTLGLPHQFELPQEELERRYRDLQRALHPDRHQGASATQRRMTLMKAMEVNEAYRTLRDKLRRAEALLAHHGVKEAGEPADPTFLMEIMELREELGEARAASDRARIDGLKSRVQGMRDEAFAALTSGFSALENGSAATGAGTNTDVPSELVTALGKLRYYSRFLDEVRAIEEDEGP